MYTKTAVKIGIAASPLFLLGMMLVPPVFAEPYGWSPQVDFSNQGPPTCTDAGPDKAPVLLQPNHPALPKANRPGQIRLQWHKVPGATGYNIYYGLSPKNYIFSVPDLPDTDNYTVGFLENRTYYFVIQARGGCAAGPKSQEWPGRPGSGAIRMGSTVLGISDVQDVQTVTPFHEKAAVVPPPYEDEQADVNVRGITTTNDAQQEPVYQLPTTPPTPPKQTAAPVEKGFWSSFMSLLGLGQ